MSREYKQRFREFVNSEQPHFERLPLVHITDGYNLEDILSPKTLNATPCKVFNKDILYMFYGKPAYRTKNSGSAYLSCHLPCVFIFDTSKVSKDIAAVYPFDTGAFDAGLYKAFFHESTQIGDFLLSDDIEAAQKTVQSFFSSNREYFEGKSRKNVPVPSMNFEVEGYVELSRTPAHPDASSKISADERSFAVEIQFSEGVSLKESLIACILPQNFFDLPKIKNLINEINPKKIKTYTSIHKMSSDGLSGKIYEIVEEIYREMGLL